MTAAPATPAAGTVDVVPTRPSAPSSPGTRSPGTQLRGAPSPEPLSPWIPAPAPDHAAPLPAVDAYRVATVDGEVRVEARTAVPDGGALRGHFPGLPIYPGVFVLESLCQAMTLAVGDGEPVRLHEVRSVRFLAPLLAGDEMSLHVTASRVAGPAWRVRCTARRRDGTAAAEITADLGPAEALPEPGPAKSRDA